MNIKNGDVFTGNCRLHDGRIRRHVGHHGGAGPGQEVRGPRVPGLGSVPQRRVHPLRGRPERRDEDPGVDHGQADSSDLRQDREGQLGHAGQAHQHRDRHLGLHVPGKCSLRPEPHRPGANPIESH